MISMLRSFGCGFVFWGLAGSLIVGQLISSGGCSRPNPDPPATSTAEAVPAAGEHAAEPPEGPKTGSQQEGQPVGQADRGPGGARSATSMPTPPGGAAAPDVAGAEAAEKPAESTPPVRRTVTDIASLKATLAAATNRDSRIEAIDAIARLRGGSRDAIPDLLSCVVDLDPQVRWHAARGLGMVGEDAIAAIPELIKLLQDVDPIVATQAAAAIGHIRADDGRKDNLPAADGELYAEATRQLVEVLVHPDPRVRRASLRALKNLAPDPAVIMPMVDHVFADGDPAVIVPALNSLADMGADALPFLVERLKADRGRYWAAVALAEMGPVAAPAVDAIVGALDEAPPEEQLQLLLTLAAIGEGASPAADRLLALYASGPPFLRLPVLYAIGKIRIAKADDLLEVAETEQDLGIASVAAWAHARIHPDDAQLADRAIDLLTEDLDAEDQEVRAAAISGISDLLSQIDPSRHESLAGLLLHPLADNEPVVHMAAAAALIRLGGPAVQTICGLLEDPQGRLVALQMLAAIGPAAATAVDRLKPLLADEDAGVRAEAALALAAIGGEASAAVPELQALLTSEGTEDHPEGDRYAAAYALGRIGKPAAPALPVLRELVSAENPLMATVAVWAALAIEPENAALYEKAIPRLTAALQAEEQLVRLEAAVALGDIGVHASSAIPGLELVAEDDPIETVRSAAQHAIRKISGQ
jgi:HEAT repeat protein